MNDHSGFNAKGDIDMGAYNLIKLALVFRAYMSVNYALASGGWAKIPFDTTSFNTLPGTFSSADRRFTPSKAGYYQISITGYSSTDGADSERYAIGVYKNGSNQGFTGSNFGVGDTPLACPTLTVYCNGTTDYLEIWMFSAVAITLAGGNTGGHGMAWFMNYLGL